MLGAELGQMPAWYVELSYALALEQCALLQQQPKSPALLALEQGMLLWVSAACNAMLSTATNQATQQGVTTAWVMTKAFRKLSLLSWNRVLIESSDGCLA